MTEQPSGKEKIERAILDLETTGGVREAEIARRAKANIVREMDPEQIVLPELQGLARNLAKRRDMGPGVELEEELTGGAFVPDDLQPRRGESSALNGPFIVG